MKFKKINHETILKKKRNDVGERIDEFLGMNIPCAEIVFDEDEYVNASSCSSSYRHTIKHSNREGAVEVHLIDGHVYIFNIKLYKRIKE